MPLTVLSIIMELLVTEAYVLPAEDKLSVDAEARALVAAIIAKLESFIRNINYKSLSASC